MSKQQVASSSVPTGAAGHEIALLWREIVRDALLKHWYRETAAIEYFWYFSRSCGPSERMLRAQAKECFAAFANILGEETTNRAIAEVDAEFRTKHPYYWRAFRRGIDLKRTPEGIPLPEDQQPPLWTPKAKRKAA